MLELSNEVLINETKIIREKDIQLPSSLMTKVLKLSLLN